MSRTAALVSISVLVAAAGAFAHLVHEPGALRPTGDPVVSGARSRTARPGPVDAAASRERALESAAVLAPASAPGRDPQPPRERAAPKVPGPVVVGIVPGPTEAQTREVERGARIALDAHPGAARVEVGRPGSHWGNAASEAVRLVREHHAVALVGPPDRATCHLAAQIATKMRIPLVSTAPEASVSATGSTWVITLSGNTAVPGFVDAYRARHGTEPGPGAAEGHAAMEEVLRALSLTRDSGLSLHHRLRGAERPR